MLNINRIISVHALLRLPSVSAISRVVLYVVIHGSLVVRPAGRTHVAFPASHFRVLTTEALSPGPSFDASTSDHGPQIFSLDLILD